MSKEIVSVWFDRLGFDIFQLNKVAFTLFGKLEVRWYGIFITLGIVLAFVYAWFRGKYNEGIVLDDILDVGLVTVILGVIGARLYYVLTSLDQFPTLGSVFAIWNGGLGIYGGIIGGCLGILLVCRIKKLNWIKLFDMIAPGVMIAQAVGRWGNFFNGEAYGYPIGETTKYFFFLKEFELNSGEGTFFNLFRMGLYPNDIAGTMVYVHPTFLYESVWNIVGFLIINAFYKHKKFDGQIALMYFSWYGFGRMFIEGLRTDSLYIFKGLISEDGLRISQCVGLLCFVVGVTLLIVFGIKASKKKVPALAGCACAVAGEAVEPAADSANAAEAQNGTGMEKPEGTDIETSKATEPEETEATDTEETEVTDTEETEVTHTEESEVTDTEESEVTDTEETEVTEPEETDIPDGEKPEPVDFPAAVEEEEKKNGKEN